GGGRRSRGAGYRAWLDPAAWRPAFWGQTYRPADLLLRGLVALPCRYAGLLCAGAAGYPRRSQCGFALRVTSPILAGAGSGRLLMYWMQRLFRKKITEDRLDSELRFHLEQRTQELADAGMTPQEARRNAQLDFGGMEGVKEECRESRRVHVIET